MDTIQIMKAEAQIRELQNALRVANIRYSRGISQLSDVQYDIRYAELVLLEKSFPQFCDVNSPTQTVGAPVSSNRLLVTHDWQMLSLDNAFTEEDFLKWAAKTGDNTEYVLEPKYDGVAVKLEYIDGMFARASLRGDGKVGEDITANVRTIRNIPKQIPYTGHFEIRGEVVMHKSVFKQLNAQLEAFNKPLMANTRNSAAGALRQLDPKICSDKRLSFYAYDAETFDTEAEEYTHTHLLGLLLNWGFSCWQHKVCESPQKVIQAYKDYIQDREGLNFVIDGLVIKCNSSLKRVKLGENGKFPLWAIAWKFPPAQVTTKIVGLRIQVGRTGQITPVADIEPVECSGVVITRVTLHNEEQLARLGGVAVGASCTVQRAGDVIPEITGVTLGEYTMPWQIPANCPACNSLIVKTGAKHFCTNSACKGRLAELIQYSAKVLGIDGVGPEMAETVIQKYNVESLVDFYLLEGSQGKVAVGNDFFVTTIRTGLRFPEEVSLAKFIECLGIPGIAETKAYKAAAEIGSWFKLGDANLDGDLAMSLAAEVGPDKHFAYSKVARVLNVQAHPVITGGPLSGKTVVVTGTLLDYNRDSVKVAIQSAGGTVGSGVSKKTSYLVVGIEPGANKVADAEKHGIKCLTEAEFKAILDT